MDGPIVTDLSVSSEFGNVTNITYRLFVIATHVRYETK